MGLKKGYKIHITGTVQGVGFRPFVYNLARSQDLKGTISNTSRGVIIKICASEDELDLFLKVLREKAPPLAEIEDVNISEQNGKIGNASDFTIAESRRDAAVTTLIPSDIATCRECLADIFDPGNKRFHYAFTNCTNCGPRYTIIKGLPYDRPATSMKKFKMCSQCLAEYEDPADRRFHAQPNACPLCGPRLWLTDGTAELERGTKALAHCAALLAEGAVAAVKGLGGFHLAADAASPEAVKRLRERKRRPFKPFAVMVRNIETAKRICRLSAHDEELLLSPHAPILLVKKRRDFPLPGTLSPNLDELGIMIPYTPLHQLLFAQRQCPDVLIMTSGNPNGEPLCTTNEEALERLSSFADIFLLHDRDIYTGVDDSVVRSSGKTTFFVRRSRGYAPSPIRLEIDTGQIIALGAELKNTICLTRGRYAFLSQHIGDLANPAVYDFMSRNIEHLKKVLEIEPKAIAADLHPDYPSTRYAKALDLPLFQIQHHHAHAASVMAEHGLNKQVLSLILDGTGLGTDNTIWGGEILLSLPESSKRLGGLTPFMLPGGDAAAKEPWRSALSLLHKTKSLGALHLTGLKDIAREKLLFVENMLNKGINSPVATSCGRLFDSVASMLGICHQNSYEGQAAMELEAMALKEISQADITTLACFRAYFADSSRYWRKREGKYEVEWPFIVKEILKMMHAGEAIGMIALHFHAFLAAAFSGLLLHLAGKTGITDLVLGGGTMQNMILRSTLESQLTRSGLRVFLNRKVPPNDGGISLGQAYAASILFAKEKQ